jgi:hypothetical protein
MLIPSRLALLLAVKQKRIKYIRLVCEDFFSQKIQRWSTQCYYVHGHFKFFLKGNYSKGDPYCRALLLIN